LANNADNSNWRTHLGETTNVSTGWEMVRRYNNRLVPRALLAAALIVITASAHADFVSAFKNYREGKFAEAIQQFTALAELGDGDSQFNLGVMAVRGEGRDKNTGDGVGWMTAAVQNGYRGLAAEKLAAYRAQLTPAQVQAAEIVVARYGKDAIRNRVLPSKFGCQDLTPAKAVQIARPLFPTSALDAGQDGVVIAEFAVGVDGLVRDPQILAAVPANVFDDSAIDTLLKSRFEPARLRQDSQNRAIESRHNFRITYSVVESGVLWNLAAIKKMALRVTEWVKPVHNLIRWQVARK
jgi:TonB family protein